MHRLHVIYTLCFRVLQNLETNFNSAISVDEADERYTVYCMLRDILPAIKQGLGKPVFLAFPSARNRRRKGTNVYLTAARKNTLPSEPVIPDYCLWNKSEAGLVMDVPTNIIRNGTIVQFRLTFSEDSVSIGFITGDVPLGIIGLSSFARTYESHVSAAIEAVKIHTAVLRGTI